VAQAQRDRGAAGRGRRPGPGCHRLHVDTGFGSAAGDLRNMVRDRGVVTGAALGVALALLVLPPSVRPRLVALQMVSHARQRIVAACHVHGTVEPSFATVMGPPGCQ
jgi:hypothetical protein